MPAQTEITASPETKQKHDFPLTTTQATPRRGAGPPLKQNKNMTNNPAVEATLRQDGTALSPRRATPRRGRRGTTGGRSSPRWSWARSGGGGGRRRRAELPWRRTPAAQTRAYTRTRAQQQQQQQQQHAPAQRTDLQREREGRAARTQNAQSALPQVSPAAAPAHQRSRAHAV